jgi:hypothetical protein
MRKLGLRTVPKQKIYKSYQGTVEKIASNLMNQSFETTVPYQKFGTDITQFQTPYVKLYLSYIPKLKYMIKLYLQNMETPFQDRQKKPIEETRNFSR